MRFLINCSNLKTGGGLQVADSICCSLGKYPQHQFYVVLSSALRNTKKKIESIEHVKIFEYNIQNNYRIIFLGRDAFMDGLVEKKQIDAVLTVFGPSRWNPRCPHICGFARAQLVLKDSPHYQRINLKEKLIYKIWKWSFRRSSKVFYTENPYISKMLPNLLGKNIQVYSVTNYYNQIFDEPKKWQEKTKIQPFNGTSILTISSAASHKNLPIMAEIAKIWLKEKPAFQFRFILTLRPEQCSWVSEEIKSHFLFLGKIDISECPPLYQKCQVMFMPTLMECFTATYVEAMKMEVPIVTTDLEFARGLCGDAACYYDAIDPKAAAEAIYKVATDKDYAKRLTDEGKKQLLTFDNYEQRTEKLIRILESLSERNAAKI